MADAPYDPFDDFNRFHALGVVRDPYPRLAELRRACPIHKGTLRGMCGQPELPWEIGNSYIVLTHDAATRVLLDGETFSSAVYARSLGRVFGHSIIEMDEPEHSRYRGLIQKAFTKGALDRWEHQLVRPIVNRMIDRFAGRGRADLVRELTFPFPVAVIASSSSRTPSSSAVARTLIRFARRRAPLGQRPREQLPEPLRRADPALRIRRDAERLRRHPVERREVRLVDADHPCDPAAEDVHISGLTFRSPLALPVVFDPS